MATETKAASGYISVSRSDDNGGTWSLGGTLGLDDSNWAIQEPFKADPPGLPSQMIGCNCSTLLVTFAAFTFPPTDVIISASITVKHKQAQASPDAGSGLQFENTGSVLSSPTDVTENFTIDVSLLDEAQCLAGTQTYALLYKGTGSSPLPLSSGMPKVGVNIVSLTVETQGGAPGGVFAHPRRSIRRIPEQGVS